MKNNRFATFVAAAFVTFLIAPTVLAATVTMTTTPGVVRPQLQGGGTYDVYDFFWTNAPGAQFTNYTVTGSAASGTFADPARLQDDRQTNPAAAGQDGNTAGAVDMWANTVWSSAGKVDFGLTATILPDPGGYIPTGSGAQPPFTYFKWDVFDNVLGDDNNLNDDGDYPTPATAPYHIMRVLMNQASQGTISFLAYDTSQPGTAFPFNFHLGGFHIGPPVVDPEPAETNPDTTQGDIITTTFTATDPDPNPPYTFSNATLASFVPLIPGATNPAFNGTVASNGDFTWDTTGFARGVYTINVTVTDAGPIPNSSSGGGFVVTIENVPEPTSVAVCGLAIASLIGLVRRPR